MAIVITSFTPETGSALGGNEVTVTGTGLDVVDAVFVGNNAATIIGEPTATQVVFKTPPHAAGNADVSLLDVGAEEAVKAVDPFVYTAAPAIDQLVSTLAGKFALRVRHVGDTDYTQVRGTTTIKLAQDYSTEDDSDTDSGLDQTDFVVGRKNSVTGTVRRGRGALSGNYDPGQEIVRLASEANVPIEGQIYDRTGGPEAYSFTALAQWARQGGNKTSDKVDFTLSVQGALTTIANPVIADPTLAGPYGG